MRNKIDSTIVILLIGIGLIRPTYHENTFDVDQIPNNNNTGDSRIENRFDDNVDRISPEKQNETYANVTRRYIRLKPNKKIESNISHSNLALTNNNESAYIDSRANINTSESESYNEQLLTEHRDYKKDDVHYQDSIVSLLQQNEETEVNGMNKSRENQIGADLEDLQQEEFDEAVKYGLRLMYDLHFVKEPLLYKLGFFLDPAEPAGRVAAFSAPNSKALLLSRYGYATVQASLKLMQKYNEYPGRENFGFSGNLRAAILSDQCPLRGTPRCAPASRRYRTADGTCNNFDHPWRGSSMTPMQRFLPPMYEDGVQSPRLSVLGGSLPSPREVSVLIHRDEDKEMSAVTLMFMQWGQFLDHDVTSTVQSRAFNGSVPRCCLTGGTGFLPPEFTHPECMPIPVSRDDWFLSHFGVRCLEFIRSAPSTRINCDLGWREQINQVTSYIDASMVYGSDPQRAESLRTFRRGQLQYGRRRSRGSLNPPDPPNGEICRTGAISTSCFLGGDPRVSEQPALTALHTVWLRYHNKLSSGLHALNPHWSDEKLYQEARRIVGALIQHITYREFLPILLGQDVLKLFELILERKGYYTGYDSRVNPTPANSFSTAAFRFGHSLVQNSFVRSNINHRSLVNSVLMHDEQDNPANIWSPGSVDRLVLGLCNQASQRRDEFISDELTNHLFQSPNSPFGMDLAAINIQRGRDHGIPFYTAWREPCGLSAIKIWKDLERVMPLETIQRLRSAYLDVDDIDLYSGGLAEKPVHGGMVGPTFACIVAQQFLNFRKGDRYWYENGNFESSFTPAQLQQIRRVNLAQILCHTLKEIDTIQPFVFLAANDFKNVRVSCNHPSANTFDLRAWAEIDLNAVQVNEVISSFNEFKQNGNIFGDMFRETEFKRETNKIVLENLRANLHRSIKTGDLFQETGFQKENYEIGLHNEVKFMPKSAKKINKGQMKVLNLNKVERSEDSSDSKNIVEIGGDGRLQDSLSEHLDKISHQNKNLGNVTLANNKALTLTFLDNNYKTKAQMSKQINTKFNLTPRARKPKAANPSLTLFDTKDDRVVIHQNRYGYVTKSSKPNLTSDDTQTDSAKLESTVSKSVLRDIKGLTENVSKFSGKDEKILQFQNRRSMTASDYNNGNNKDSIDATRRNTFHVNRRNILDMETLQGQYYEFSASQTITRTKRSPENNELTNISPFFLTEKESFQPDKNIPQTDDRSKDHVTETEITNRSNNDNQNSNLTPDKTNNSQQFQRQRKNLEALTKNEKNEDETDNRHETDVTKKTGEMKNCTKMDVESRTYGTDMTDTTYTLKVTGVTDKVKKTNKTINANNMDPTYKIDKLNKKSKIDNTRERGKANRTDVMGNLDRTDEQDGLTNMTVEIHKAEKSGTMDETDEALKIDYANNKTNKTDRTDNTDEIYKTDKSNTMDITEKANETDKTHVVVNMDKTDKIYETYKTDRTNTADETNMTLMTHKTDNRYNSAKTYKTDMTNKMDRINTINKTQNGYKTDAPDDTNRRDKADGTDATDKTDNGYNMFKTDKIDKMDTMDKTEMKFMTHKTNETDVTNKTDGTRKTDETIKTDKTNTIDETDKTFKPPKADCENSVDRAAETDEADKTDKAAILNETKKSDGTCNTNETNQAETADKTSNTNAMENSYIMNKLCNNYTTHKTNKTNEMCGTNLTNTTDKADEVNKIKEITVTDKTNGTKTIFRMDKADKTYRMEKTHSSHMANKTNNTRKVHSRNGTDSANGTYEMDQANLTLSADIIDRTAIVKGTNKTNIAHKTYETDETFHKNETGPAYETDKTNRVDKADNMQKTEATNGTKEIHSIDDMVEKSESDTIKTGKTDMTHNTAKAGDVEKTVRTTETNDVPTAKRNLRQIGEHVLDTIIDYYDDDYTDTDDENDFRDNIKFAGDDDDGDDDDNLNYKIQGRKSLKRKNQPSSNKTNSSSTARSLLTFNYTKPNKKPVITKNTQTYKPILKNTNLTVHDRNKVKYSPLHNVQGDSKVFTTADEHPNKVFPNFDESHTRDNDDPDTHGEVLKAYKHAQQIISSTMQTPSKNGDVFVLHNALVPSESDASAYFPNSRVNLGKNEYEQHAKDNYDQNGNTADSDQNPNYEVNINIKYILQTTRKPVSETYQRIPVLKPEAHADLLTYGQNYADTTDKTVATQAVSRPLTIHDSYNSNFGPLEHGPNSHYNYNDQSLETLPLYVYDDRPNPTYNHMHLGVQYDDRPSKPIQTKNPPKTSATSYPIYVLNRVKPSTVEPSDFHDVPIYVSRPSSSYYGLDYVTTKMPYIPLTKRPTTRRPYRPQPQSSVIDADYDPVFEDEYTTTKRPYQKPFPTQKPGITSGIYLAQGPFPSLESVGTHTSTQKPTSPKPPSYNKFGAKKTTVRPIFPSYLYLPEDNQHQSTNLNPVIFNVQHKDPIDEAYSHALSSATLNPLPYGDSLLNKPAFGQDSYADFTSQHGKRPNVVTTHNHADPVHKIDGRLDFKNKLLPTRIKQSADKDFIKISSIQGDRLLSPGDKEHYILSSNAKLEKKDGDFDLESNIFLPVEDGLNVVQIDVIPSNMGNEEWLNYDATEEVTKSSPVPDVNVDEECATELPKPMNVTENMFSRRKRRG